MSTLRRILFLVIILALVALIVIFWGSIFSAIVVFSLVMSLPVYLYNRFLNAEPESDFVEDDNG